VQFVKKDSTGCNNVSNFIFHIYMKLNMDVVRHTVPGTVKHLHAQQPSTYENPEDASAVLGS
jgi:hypothetical protein